MVIVPFSLQQLRARYGGRVSGPSTMIKRVVTDSRQVCKGDCFVAIRGERFDAHNFIPTVIEAGAGALVIAGDYEKSLPPCDDVSIWCVDDTIQALGYIAQWQRDHFSQPVIAITGSSGKTTVKGMLANILSAFVGAGGVCVTQGNYNNHIGVPLTLFQLSREHQYAVIEMGASAGGEIGYLSSLAKPDVAMINNVMPAHVEGFGSIDAIATAKGEIYEGLVKDGIAIINGDDVYANQWFKQNRLRSVMIFSPSGQFAQAQVFAKNYRADVDGCYSFGLTCGEQSVVVKLKVPGKHNVANAVAASACAFAVGVDIELIRKGLESFANEGARLQALSGTNGCHVIDDSYNANPGSVKAAIDVLASMKNKRILVLGDMAELGTTSDAEHREIGRYAAEKKLDYLLTLGEKSAVAVDGFGSSANAFSSLEKLIECIEPLLDSNTTVLVKGSRSSRMERVVNALRLTGDNNNAGLAR